MALTSTEKGVIIAIGIASVLLFLMLFSNTTKKPALIGILGLAMVIVVGLIVFTILYKPPSVSGRPTGTILAPLNFHNLDSALDVVNMTMPWGENLSLPSGSSVYGQEIYATEQIIATGQRGSVSYNENYTNNTITNFDIYYSTGGPKTVSQYITNMVIDNSAKMSQTTLWATDGKGVWYPYVTIQGGQIGYSTAWVGQAFANNSTGMNSIIVKTTNDSHITINSDGSLRSFSS